MEHFCEIILNLDQWFRRRCLKDFLIGALVALLFGSGTICAGRGHYGDHSREIFFEFGPMV